MAIGTVKFFNVAKGFGFITADEGGKDVFVPAASIAAANIPGLKTGQRVSFEVVAPGSRSPDAMVAFETTPGGTATLQLERLNLAERLYRVTGQGRYTDSVLLGAAAPSRARCSTPT